MIDNTFESFSINESLPFLYGYIDDLDEVEILPREKYVRKEFNLLEYFDNINTKLQSLNEESYQSRAKTATLSVELLDIDKFIKKNNLKEITNPTFFGTSGKPTPDGLLSNEIFGITQADRAGIFAYIDLGDWFIDPSNYKCLIRLNRKIESVVKGVGKWAIDKDGQLVEDFENGKSGIRWLKNNFDKLEFMKSKSSIRDLRIKYIKHNYETGKLFINKYIVIPAYYRDVNTTGKYTGVGQINTLYVNLLVASRSLKENNDYGLSVADTTCARIQETLRAIYDWFCGNNNPTLKDPGTGMAGKMGLIRRANMSYTSDYSSRLVLTAPELKAETMDDMMVNLDRSALPLAAAVADFYPFVLFHMRRFFENEFLNNTEYEIVTSEGEVKRVDIENPMIAFSDDVLKAALKNFIHSYDNRIVPIQVPIKDPKYKNRRFFMVMKAYRYEDIKSDTMKNQVEPFLQRPLTWVDVIYQAAKKATDGKKMSFTRYPYDSYFNTIYTGIEVSSTKETEPLYVDGTYYRFYPKIRMEDILQPSSNKFVDTMQISNLYIGGMCADYDGDTGMAKGSFFKETNEELANFVDSKANYITLGCNNIRQSSGETIQTMYNLTKILDADKDKITEPQF